MPSIYDSILRLWIGPMPAHTHSSVLEIKGRLAQRIATEVVLASYRLRTRHTRTMSSVESRADRDQSALPSTSDLPSQRESQPPLSSWRDTYDAKPVSLCTQPSPPALPAEPGPSYPPEEFESSALPDEDSPVAQLSQHVEVCKPPVRIPPSVSQILMHWSVGQDPHTYDWEAATRDAASKLRFSTTGTSAIDGSDVDADEELSASQSAKLQRRRDRLLQRQRRESTMAAKAEASEYASAFVAQPRLLQDLDRMRSSSGVGDFGGLAINSQPQLSTLGQAAASVGAWGSGEMVASQVERGPYGGRPPMKRRKTEGLSGFR